MDLRAAFRRAKTSAPMRMALMSMADSDTVKIWNTFADISSEVRGKSYKERDVWANSIIDYLDRNKGWNLRGNEPASPRKKLFLFMTSQLASAHQMDPLHAAYGKFVAKYLYSQEEDGVANSASYDFLLENLDDVKAAAQAVKAASANKTAAPSASP